MQPKDPNPGADAPSSPDGATPHGPVPLDVPVRLGRYELRYELASGGMATVFLARLDGPGGFERVVALKCIHRHMSRNPRFIEMFMDEARLAARINHPNVCTVYDFGETEGIYYIAMEYLLGETLAEVVRALGRRTDEDGPSVPLYVARVIADACQGLHAAHELRGNDNESMHVVHRDVSLQNLFLNYDGSVRVVDFGIARASNQMHDSVGGELKGKLAYMSPEQAQSMPVDRRTDVWALGVVMWEMLTRKRLFRRGSDVDTLTAVLTDSIPAPSKLREGIPPALDEIVLHALARDPDARYATARELGSDLGQLIAEAKTPLDLHARADWMHALFPGRREAREEVLSSTRRPLPAGAAIAASQANLRFADSVTDPTSAQTPRARQERATEDSSVVLPSRWRSGVWGVVIAALVAAVVGATSALVVQNDPSDDAAAPPAQAEPPPSSDVSGDDASQTEARDRAERSSSKPVEPEAADDAGDQAPNESEEASARRTDGEAERRPTRRTARSAPAPGKITVVTVGGWAEVYEGGRRLGRTPAQLELPAGAHRLVVRPPSGEPIERRVRLRPGGQARVVVRLGER